MIQIPFHNYYARLGSEFSSPAQPTPVVQPMLVRFNEELAQSLGISIDVSSEELAQVFSGNVIPDGAEPLAMAYSGHQFGYFNPQLGDGRAILLGEVTTGEGRQVEIQLKGCGRTRYSRDGDGRAALGPVLREYLVSEAMAKLGVPTTRALAAVATGEPVRREQILPGGVITRTATSFVRVGTFQYFAARGDVGSIKTLADHVIDRRYPAAREASNPYIALLTGVVDAQADLIAQWMTLGFIHGVMNTDNMSVVGETIDYGPCAFMDAYEHSKVYSSIDHYGRYAYNAQPPIALWNLTRLAESLAPLLAEDTGEAVTIAEDILKSYINKYESCWLARMRSKCGLTSVAEVDDTRDRKLFDDLLDTMAINSVDYTLMFRYLSGVDREPSAKDDRVRQLFDNPVQCDAWLSRWRERLQHEPDDDATRQRSMHSINPAVIPRNHRIEEAIRAAEDHGDFSVFRELHEVLQTPYELAPDKQAYAQPPEPEEEIQQTFCGT